MLDRPFRLVADPYPPYQYERDGEIKGTDYEIVTSALRLSGILATTELWPWGECLTRLREGQADAIFQITPTLERREWLSFSKPFRLARTLLYARERVSVRPNARTLDGLRVGVLRAFSYAPEIDAIPGKVEYDCNEDLIHAVLGGAVDVAPVDAGVAEHLLAGLKASALHEVPGFEITRPVHLAARHKWVDVVRAFDAGIEAIGSAEWSAQSLSL